MYPVGEMLVGPAGALFMDEISTGLDSSTTFQIVNSLRQSVRNNHAMDMSLCHEGVLVEHECVCESRCVRVRRVGACRTIVKSGCEREFVPPQPLVVWG
jgi:ABC-type Mn2+/Zn2+ transport system ATPase subunit